MRITPPSYPLTERTRLTPENQRQGLGLKLQWYGIPNINSDTPVLDHLSEKILPVFVEMKQKMNRPSEQFLFAVHPESTRPHSKLYIIPRIFTKDSNGPHEKAETGGVLLLRDYLSYIKDALDQTKPDALSLINTLGKEAQSSFLKDFPDAVKKELSNPKTIFSRGEPRNQLYLNLMNQTDEVVQNGIQSMSEFLGRFNNINLNK